MKIVKEKPFSKNFGETYVYTIYDKVSKVFGDFVFKALNHDDAKRSFFRFLSDRKELDVEDYSLYYVGTYNRVKGTIFGLKEPDLIAKGMQMPRREINEKVTNGA